MKKISILIISILFLSMFSGCISEKKEVPVIELTKEEEARAKLLWEKVEFIDKSYDTEKNIETFIKLLETIEDLAMEYSVYHGEDATKISVTYKDSPYNNEMAGIEQQYLYKALCEISKFAEIKIWNPSPTLSILYFINMKDTLNYGDRLYIEVPFEVEHYDPDPDEQVEWSKVVPYIQRILDLHRNGYIWGAEVYIGEKETEEGFTYDIDINFEVMCYEGRIQEEMLIICNILALYIEETNISIYSRRGSISYSIRMDYTSQEQLSFDSLIPTETFYDGKIYLTNWGFDPKGNVWVSFRCEPPCAYKAILMDEKQNILSTKESKLSSCQGYNFYIDISAYTENILFLKIIAIPENELFIEAVDWLRIDREKEFIDRAKPSWCI